MAADIAVCNYDDGFSSIIAIMQIMGLKIGNNCYNFCVEAKRTDA